MNTCYNCDQEIEDEDGDWRHSEEEGDHWFCQSCLDNGSVDENEWS